MRKEIIGACVELCSSEYTPGTQGVLWGEDLVTISRYPAGSIVAFRGTATPLAWLSDFQARPVESRPWPVKVHEGFAESLLGGSEKVLQALFQGEPLILTGHSRGGAMATLFAYLAQQRGYDVRAVVTFGEPRSLVGGIDWPFEHIRVVNEFDPVPHMVPTVMGYRHVVQETWLTETNLLAALWSRVCRGLGMFAAEAIGDHHIDQYVEAVGRQSD